MSDTILIILSAIIPAIVLLVYILIRDRKRPEPFSQIAKGFWYGCLSVAMVLIYGVVLQKLGLLVSDTSNVGNAIEHAFFVAAFPEEAAKMYMLWLLLRKNPFFDEHVDGIVYAVCIGMGFAATENVFYLFANINSWQSVAVSRAFLSIPEHFCLAVIMGYFFALARMYSDKRWYYMLAYFVPVLIHGIYDACIYVLNIPAWGTSAIVSMLFMGCFIFGIWYSKQAIKKHLDADDLMDKNELKDNEL